MIYLWHVVFGYHQLLLFIDYLDSWFFWGGNILRKLKNVMINLIFLNFLNFFVDMSILVILICLMIIISLLHSLIYSSYSFINIYMI